MARLYRWIPADNSSRNPGADSAPGKYDAVWVAMAKGLKDGSSGNQLVCYHCPASCPWQQPAGITLHDGMKLWGIERRLDQLQEGCLHREIGGMRTEDDSFDGDAG